MKLFSLNLRYNRWQELFNIQEVKFYVLSGIYKKSRSVFLDLRRRAFHRQLFRDDCRADFSISKSRLEKKSPAV